MLEILTISRVGIATQEEDIWTMMKQLNTITQCIGDFIVAKDASVCATALSLEDFESGLIKLGIKRGRETTSPSHRCKCN